MLLALYTNQSCSFPIENLDAARRNTLQTRHQQSTQRHTPCLSQRLVCLSLSTHTHCVVSCRDFFFLLFTCSTHQHLRARCLRTWSSAGCRRGLFFNGPPLGWIVAHTLRGGDRQVFFSLFLLQPLSHACLPPIFSHALVPSLVTLPTMSCGFFGSIWC